MLYLIYSYGFKIIAYLKLTIAIFIFFQRFPQQISIWAEGCMDHGDGVSCRVTQWQH